MNDEAVLRTAIREGMAATGTPGVALVCFRDGQERASIAEGAAQIHDDVGPLDEPVPMTVDALADVASITKLLATTVVALRGHAAGWLPLDLPIDRCLDVTGPGTEGVTVEHLLTHRSGHLDWRPVMLEASDRSEALACLADAPLAAPPGTVTRYSDLGMMLLGLVLEQLGDDPLDVLTARHLAKPLGLQQTGFRHIGRGSDPSASVVAASVGNPVERGMVADRFPAYAGREPVDGWRTHLLRGEVNDANAAHAFGGVAGHAGLFSTAPELARVGQALLDALAGCDDWVSGELVRRWMVPGPDGRCGRGFWTQRLRTSSEPSGGLPGSGEDLRPDGGRDATVGHRGFTGCELLIDPDSQTVLSLVSNRLHGVEVPREHLPLWRSVLRGVELAPRGSGPRTDPGGALA